MRCDEVVVEGWREAILGLERAKRRDKGTEGTTGRARYGTHRAHRTHETKAPMLAERRGTGAME